MALCLQMRDWAAIRRPGLLPHSTPLRLAEYRPIPSAAYGRLALQPAFVLLGDLRYQSETMLKRIEIGKRLHILAQPEYCLNLLQLFPYLLEDWRFLSTRVGPDH